MRRRAGRGYNAFHDKSFALELYVIQWKGDINKTKESILWIHKLIRHSQTNQLYRRHQMSQKLRLLTLRLQSHRLLLQMVLWLRPQNHLPNLLSRTTSALTDTVS